MSTKGCAGFFFILKTNSIMLLFENSLALKELIVKKQPFLIGVFPSLFYLYDLTQVKRNLYITENISKRVPSQIAERPKRYIMKY